MRAQKRRDLGALGLDLVAGASMDHGEKIAEGDFEAVTSDERVIEAYLGRRHKELG